MGKSYKKINTPSILQMEAVECGSTSLAIVLAYHGAYISLEQLRGDCDVNRDGSKASNVIKAARKYHLTAKGYRRTPETVFDLPLPFIVHWNFNHFLVVEGRNSKKVFLNDPASGHRTVSIEEFNKSFTGVVLSFEKQETFEKVGKKESSLSTLISKLKGYEQAFTYIVLLGLLMVIPGLLMPVFSRIFVDDILIGGADDWFLPLIIGMLMTAAFRSTLIWMRGQYLLKMRTKLSLTASAHFFWHVLRLPVDFFSQRFSGEIGSRISLNRNITNMITGDLAKNFLSIITVIFYLLVMLEYDVWLTLLGVSFSMLNIIALRFVSAKRTEGYTSLAQESGKLTGVSMGGLLIIETLKATGRENDFFVKWAGHMAKVINAAQRLSRISIILSTVPVILRELTTISILILGSLRVMDGFLTMGMLVAFQSLMSSFQAPISSLVSLGGSLQKVHGDMVRLDDVLKAKTDPQVLRDIHITNSDFSPITQKLAGYIELKDVTFGYSTLSAPLIKNFSLKIRPGERVALVGGSGSGKSTVAKLISGLYEPWSGEILFDGKPRSEWPRQVLCNSIGMVDQDIFLFEGSVREVITLWDKTITDRILIQATQDACIHDDISKKSNSYDHNVREGGKNFSGGQRQRIEIARALAITPSVLILDEATSALDPTTEKRIDDHIKKRKCSVVVIAHRLSTIRDSNEIIVLNRGEIVERGTHEELREQKGYYWNLIQA